MPEERVLKEPAHTLEHGNALVGVLITTIAISGLLYATLTTTSADLRTSSLSVDDVRAHTVAQAAIRRMAKAGANNRKRIR